MQDFFVFNSIWFYLKYHYISSYINIIKMHHILTLLFLIFHHQSASSNLAGLCSLVFFGFFSVLKILSTVL